MKALYLSFFLIIVISCFNSFSYSQEVNHRKNNPDRPLFFTPKSHDPNFLKSANFPDKSFYQRKSEWKHIIDSVWGPGTSLNKKLEIFNNFAKGIQDYSDFFHYSTELNYDSLCNFYRDKIDETTSKGAFSAIMSHFAFEFEDMHTFAFDTTVVFSPLNPGTPVLLLGNGNSMEHFGAFTTILPDSTTLVLRVCPNHPLNLKPGDIILGYEGVPWKSLVKELLNAEIPVLGNIGGCKTAATYQSLIGVGLNWHLFNTIDILKYDTGDTIHLSVEPLLQLDYPVTMNNEQLSLANIPFPIFPSYFHPEGPVIPLTYGILENTNIGYIYLSLEFPYFGVDQYLVEALDSLKNTDALIIDMRFNGGGQDYFTKSFDLLFNENFTTVEHVTRCDAHNFKLCQGGNLSDLQINSKNPNYFDRPIAVLLGPSCWSYGDITAQRLRYHPMIRFFGASSNASCGWHNTINIPDWRIEYSIADLHHYSDPDVYLNKKEFPIDFPVWFNKDDVGKGIDPIVEKAKEWICNLAYGHSLVLDRMSLMPEKDTIQATAIIENPESHDLSAMLIIESIDKTVVDSTQIAQSAQNQEKQWQAHFTISDLPENFYWVSLKVEDKTNGTFFTNKHMTRFTTVPLIIDSLDVKKLADYKYSIQPYIKNEGNTKNIEQTISVKLNANPWATLITPSEAYCATLKPRQVQKLTAFKLSCDTATFQSHFDLKFTIASQGWPYWVLDTTIALTPTSIYEKPLLPSTNLLNQNYPNPFNDHTTIQWQLAKSCKASLSVYDIMGRKVAVLVDEYRPAGKYETLINASTLPKGIYFYQLKAGKFIQTKKMIVVK